MGHETIDIVVAADQKTATASCRVRYTSQGLRDRAPTTDQRNYRFTLERTAGEWIVREAARLQ